MIRRLATYAARLGAAYGLGVLLGYLINENHQLALLQSHIKEN